MYTCAYGCVIDQQPHTPPHFPTHTHHTHTHTHTHHTVAVVSLDPTEYTIMENMTSVRVCAMLQGEAELEITASLRTTDGTARGKHTR